MNKKLKLTLKVIDSVASEYPDTKIYIEENLKRRLSSGRGKLYFVFEFFEQIHGLRFHALSILF